MLRSAIARENMMLGQLLPSQVISSPVLDAMASVPREQFVPESLAGVAYVDEDIKVFEGRYLLAPVALAKLVLLADVQPNDRVLDVGCASGYSSAVLSKLAHHVTALEEERELSDRARQNMSRLHLGNVEVMTGPHTGGYIAHAPYDVIFIGGAVSRVPPVLLRQLAEGGRLVVVQNVSCRTGSDAGLGRATLMKKMDGKIFTRQAFDLSVPLLSGFEAKETFVF